MNRKNPKKDALFESARRPEYRPEYCERVVSLGREGKSKAQIAATLGVSRTLLANWSERHPEFGDAMQRAHDLAQAWFEDVGQAGLTTAGFNAGLWSKMVAARFPAEYRETTRAEITTRQVSHPRELSDEELMRIIAAEAADPS